MSKILIVEDDAPNQLLLSLQLEDLEMDIATANNGSEALAQLRQNVPQVIILDLNMPQLNGIEFMESIMNMAGRPPVVVVSAMDLMLSLRQRLESMGVRAFFQKGNYDEDDLLSCVESLLAAH